LLKYILNMFDSPEKPLDLKRPEIPSEIRLSDQ